MSAVARAKATLLRALDELEQAEAELAGPVDRVDLVVTYSIGRADDPEDPGSWYEVSGWASTPGPKWLHVAMLRRAADAQDEAARAIDDDPEDDDQDDER